MDDDADVPPGEESYRDVPVTPVSPWTVLVIGAVLEVTGVIVYASAVDNESTFGEAVGLLITGIGGVMLLLGIVAGGILLALRFHAHESTRDPRG